MSLLSIFFVMLVSMSKIKKDAQFQVAHVDKSSRPISKKKKFREVATGSYKVSRRSSQVEKYNDGRNRSLRFSASRCEN